MNDRFVFENREISEWLLQLVSNDAQARKAAAKVVTNHFFMPADLIMQEKDPPEVIQEQFRAAVRGAVNKPGFPAGDFASKALLLCMAVQESWIKKANNFRQEDEPHEITTTFCTIVYVIEALGNELIPAAEHVRLMLEHKSLAYIASDAIARMGRAGLEFYPDLLDGLKTEDPNYYSAKALGALLRHAPDKIGEVLELACGEDSRVRINAVATLGFCGRPATSTDPNVEARVRERLKTCLDRTEWYELVFAIGKVAESRESIVLLVGMLQAKEVHKVGPVIDALGDTGMEADLVVPRLIESLEGFTEYDPDWYYYGNHGRVVSALRKFGPAAAPAARPLSRLLWINPERPANPVTNTWPELDNEIVKFLGELGPLAREALPALIEALEVARSHSARSKTDPDGTVDFLKSTISKIQRTV